MCPALCSRSSPGCSAMLGTTDLLLRGGAAVFCACISRPRLALRRLNPDALLLALPLALLLLYALVQGMPNPAEGLYWFNGAVNYQLFFAVAVLNAGFTLALALPGTSTLRSRLGLMAGGVLAGLVIGGGHQVVGVMNLLVLLFALALCAPRRNFRHLPALIAAVVGLVINLTAPGTRVRVDGFSGAGFFEAVAKSFLLAVSEWIRWLDVPLLCCCWHCWPCRWPRWLARMRWMTVHSAALVGRGGRLCVDVGMIFLPSYSMGGIGAGRLINVVWMTFVLGLVVTEFLLLGWAQRVCGLSFAGAARVLQRQARRLPGWWRCCLSASAASEATRSRKGRTIALPPVWKPAMSWPAVRRRHLPPRWMGGRNCFWMRACPM